MNALKKAVGFITGPRRIVGGVVQAKAFDGPAELPRPDLDLEQFRDLPAVEVAPIRERVPAPPLVSEDDTESVPDRETVILGSDSATGTSDPADQTLRPKEVPSDKPPLAHDGGGPGGSLPTKPSIWPSLAAAAVVAAILSSAISFAIGSKLAASAETNRREIATQAMKVTQAVATTQNAAVNSEKAAETAAQAAATAKEHAEAVAKHTGRAEAAAKQAGQQLTEVRHVAKDVSRNISRAEAAAANAEKVVSSANIDDWRAEIARFRADMHKRMASNGSGDMAEKLEQFRQDLAKDMAKDRANFLKAANQAARGIAITEAKTEIRRVSNLPKAQREQFRKGGL